jgi:citrate lyase subunit beta/citryl-CoA lyase
MTAWNEALARGDGLCVLNGKLVENLHAEEATRLLALYEQIAARTHD